MKNGSEIKEAVNKASDNLFQDILAAVKTYQEYTRSLFKKEEELGDYLDFLLEGAFNPIISALGHITILQSVANDCDREEYTLFINKFLHTTKGMLISIYDKEVEHIANEIQKIKKRR